jgi:hypothetical protein
MIFALLNPRKITFSHLATIQKTIIQAFRIWGFFVEKYYIYLVVCLSLGLFQHMEPSG